MEERPRVGVVVAVVWVRVRTFFANTAASQGPNE